MWSNINFVSGYQEQDTEGEVQIGDNFENSDKSKEESAIKTFGKGSLSIAEGVVDPALGVLKGGGNVVAVIGGAVAETARVL